ncbi:MAG: CPBP family intramembrane glutamic endopeptidase [Candidatus Muiribacteriaceae bacterium]
MKTISFTKCFFLYLFLGAVGILSSFLAGKVFDISDKSGVFCGKIIVFIVLIFFFRKMSFSFGIKKMEFLKSLKYLSVMFLIGIVTALIFAFLKTHGIYSLSVQSFVADLSEIEIVIYSFVLIIIGPAQEELFFRRLFYRSLRDKYKISKAVFLGGIIFGLVHFINIQAFIMTTVLGIYFCYVFEKERNTLLNIFLHSLMNLSIFSAEIYLLYK